jgi:hypothetical protein
MKFTAQEAVVQYLGKTFADWVKTNMIAILLIFFSIIFATVMWDKNARLRKELDGFENPIPDIMVRDAAKYIQKMKRSWRDKDETEIIQYLYGMASCGNLTAWGVDHYYGRSEWQYPILLKPEFFEECQGTAEKEHDYWTWSRSVNKRYDNIKFNRAQLRRTIKTLPKL